MYFICDVNMTSLYFQQDSAPVHRACDSWTDTRHHFRLCSARHVATELTRPKSGGLCHLVCHSATCVAYKTRVHDIDELRQRLQQVWCSLEQSLIDDAVDQCPTTFACLCSCQRRSFWIYFVTINLFPRTWRTVCFAPYLMQQVIF